VKFLVDANLPPALARFLEKEGHEASHVYDQEMGEAKDSEIWDYALQTGAVIITKDEDFEDRSTRLSELGKVPSIIWIRLGNTTKRTLLIWFSNLLPEITLRLEAGERLIEII